MSDYVNKVKKGSTEYDIQDARIPSTTSADSGKVLAVNSSGSLGFIKPSTEREVHEVVMADFTYDDGDYILRPSPGILYYVDVHYLDEEFYDQTGNSEIHPRYIGGDGLFTGYGITDSDFYALMIGDEPGYGTDFSLNPSDDYFYMIVDPITKLLFLYKWMEL